MMGANIALTGIWFSDKTFMVFSLFLMEAVRGSKTLLVSSFKEVTEILTTINRCLFNSFNKSKSLKIKEFLVMIPTGCRYFKKTSRQALVILYFCSAG